MTAIWSAYLTKMALEQPSSFLALLGRVLPLQLQSENKNTLVIRRVEYVIIDPKEHEMSKKPSRPIRPKSTTPDSRRKHHLLCLPVLGGYMHGYVITSTNDRAVFEAVLQRMINAAEKLGINDPMMGMITLQTTLDGRTARRIQTHLRRKFPEAAAKLDTMKDFHFTAWATPPSGADVDWLMKLH